MAEPPKSQKRNPASASPTRLAERSYTFFTTTSEKPTLPHGQARDLIRRTVMRNFFDTKAAGPKDVISEITSKETVNAKSNLKSRFRLTDLDKLDGAERKNASAKTKINQPGKAKGKDSSTFRKSNRRPLRKSSTPATQSQSVEPERDVECDEENAELRNEVETVAVETGESEKQLRVRSKLLLKINPNAGCFDPFDVLPIPGSAELSRLFNLQKYARANSIAINARKTWWSFISQDAALLHATLATWALYGVLAKNIHELKVEKLRHKTEAIKQINLKLMASAGTVSDELIGAVLTMASFEHLLGEYDAGQMHMSALKRMVCNKGGLTRFGHNDGLLRGIIWVDFHSATAFHTAPVFPRIRLDSNAPPLPEALEEEAAYTSPNNLLQLSLAAVDLFNIFHKIHRLALATSSRWLPRVDRLTLSDLLYETEYTVLSVPDYSYHFTNLDRGIVDTEGQLPEGLWPTIATADSASVVEALLAGVQIFMYAALREIPQQAEIFRILLTRLRTAIDRPGIDLVSVWKREGNLNTLLWALMVAATVAGHGNGRQIWLDKMAEVCTALQLQGPQMLIEALERVAWNDVFFSPRLDAIWTEVQEIRATKEKEAWLEEVHKEVEPSIQDDPESNDPIDVPEVGFEQPIEFKAGRWKVGGWYI